MTVVDKLPFGGESLLGCRHPPRFRFTPGDVTEPGTLEPASGGLRVGRLAPAAVEDEIVSLVQRHVPGTAVEVKDLTFGGDMRDIRVSFARIRRALGFEPTIDVEAGVREVRDALQDGLIRDAGDERYRNAEFIVR